MGALYTLPKEDDPRLLGWLVSGENCTALGYRICQRAMLDVGILEVPNGSNRGTRIDRYTKRAGLPVPKDKRTGEGWWWCAILVGCVFADADARVPRDFPATAAWLAHIEPGGPKARPQPGDAVLYGVNGTPHHIGIVVRVPEPQLKQTLTLTIEGNRGFAGSTNNGVAVDIGPMLRKDILGYIRPQPV